MGSNKRLYITLGIILLVIAILIVMFFEYRPVVDRSWTKSYDSDSKDPYGTWLFKELIKESYAEATFSEERPTLGDTTGLSEGLYVRVADLGGVTVGARDTLLQFLHEGNTAVIFVSSFGNLDTLYNDQYYSYNRFFEGTLKLRAMGEYVLDSVTYSYTDYDKELRPSKGNRAFTVFEHEYYYDSLTIQDLVVTDSSFLSVLVSVRVGENGGQAFLCAMPELVSNLGLQQSSVALLLDQVLSNIPTPTIIYWDSRPGVYIKNDFNGSPLKYILSKKALRLAYYTLLSLGMLFLIFRSKRRQRPIPIKQEYKNTSLEYIDTLSKLYQGNDNHEKLVAHLEKIFYHQVEKQYYISKDHPDFVGILAKKSRQSEEDISLLLERFATARSGAKFSYYQLQKVTERIDTILETTKHAST